MCNLQECPMSSYTASFPGLRQDVGSSRYRWGMGLRNLQISSLINCPNGTEPFLGDLLQLAKPSQTSQEPCHPYIKPLVRYGAFKLPLAGQESPQGKGIFPSVAWPWGILTPKTKALAKSHQLSRFQPVPSPGKQNQRTFPAPSRNAAESAAASRGHSGL